MWSKRACIVFSLVGGSAFAQVIYPEKTFSLPGIIKESSGIVHAGKSQYITHNDGGNTNEIFFIDSTGKLLKTVEIKAENNDWEDISLSGNQLIIADIGNNMNTRKNLSIISYHLKTGNTEKFKIQYGNQNDFPPDDHSLNFDAEALLAWKDSAFIFTKNRTKPYSGYTYMYAFSLSGEKNVKLMPLDSFYTGDKGFITNSITGAAISKNGKVMALTSCLCLYVFYDYPPGDFFNGKFAVFRYSDFTQKEAICFNPDNTLGVTDEKVFSLGGRMLYYDVFKFVDGYSAFYTPVIEQSTVKFSKGKSKIQFDIKTKEKSDLLIAVHQRDGKEIYRHRKANTSQLKGEIENTLTIQSGFYRVYAGKQLLYAARLK